MMLGRVGGIAGGCNEVVESISSDPPAATIMLLHFPEY
jgi:hypothetical protein